MQKYHISEQKSASGNFLGGMVENRAINWSPIFVVYDICLNMYNIHKLLENETIELLE